MTDKKILLKATHQGSLKINDISLPCAVLENGTRILTIASVFKALGRPRKGTKRVENMPSFLESKALVPYLNRQNRADQLTMLRYRTKNNKVSGGYSAEILPIICDIYLEARLENKLTKAQLVLAERAEVLVRSLSKVGIIALVDEATGYQNDRQKDELQKILGLYISAELLPWQKRFPNEYYQHIARLKDWDFNPLSNKRPQIIGKITNDIVYKLLPIGVLEELKKVNPVNENGNRSHRFHQFLTMDIGNNNLEKHLAQIVILMRISKTWNDFEEKMVEAFPRYGISENMEVLI